MERDIFPREEVFKQFENDFVLVHLYTDHQEDPKPAQTLEKYAAGGSVQVPLYFVVDEKGKVISKLEPPTNIASLSSEEFAEWLRAAKEKFDSRK